MPTTINYYSDGEAVTEDTLNRPLIDLEANITEIFVDGIPNWNSTTTYVANSFVSVNGAVYRSLNTNLNKEPTSNPSNWKLYEGNRQATLTERGTVTISDATDSQSTTTAASSKAVYDVETNVSPYLFPIGGIALWSGSVASIPTGWALCDGTNGTPDLRNRFVVGAGGAYAAGATGGADSVTLAESHIPTHNHGGNTGTAGSHNHTASTGTAGSHNHTASTNTAGYHGHSGSTNTTGSHTHTLNMTHGTDGGSSGIVKSHDQAGYPFTRTSGIRSNGNHSHSLSINGDGSHSHTVTVNSNGDHTHTVTVNNNGDHTHTIANYGGGQAHENRPPYYALAYIMKV